MSDYNPFCPAPPSQLPPLPSTSPSSSSRRPPLAYQHHQPTPPLAPQSPRANPFLKSATSILSRASPAPPAPSSSSHPASFPVDPMTSRTRALAQRAPSSTSTSHDPYAHSYPSQQQRATRRSSRGASSFSYNEDHLAREHSYAHPPPPAEGTRRSARSSGGGGRVSYAGLGGGEDDDDDEEHEQDAQGEEEDADASFDVELNGGGQYEGGYQGQQYQMQAQLPPQLPPLPGALPPIQQQQQPQYQQQLAENGYYLQQNGGGASASGEAGEGAAGDEGEYAPPPTQNGENGVPGGEDDEEDEDDDPVRLRPSRGAATKKGRKIVADSDEDFKADEGDGDGQSGSNSEEEYAREARTVTTQTRRGRLVKRPQHYGETDEEGGPPKTEEDGGEGEGVEGRTRRGGLRRGGGGGGGGNYGGDYVEQDDEYEQEDDEYGAPRRRNTRSAGGGGRATRASTSRRDKARRTTRTSRRGAADQSYEHKSEDDFTTDDEMLDLANDTSSNDDGDDGTAYGNDRGGAAPKRQLRNKPRINYFVPPPLDAAAQAKADKEAGKGKGKVGPRRMGQGYTNEDGNPFAGLPANMTGAQWAALYPEGGQPSDSSDDDDLPNLSSPRKNPLFSGPGALAAGGAGGGGMLASGGFDPSGGPGNLGKVGNAAALADTDPLGVPTSISFDSVGGLESHIQQLKEMVSLPLLYPEVFERFAITPPRGVLFHGPPGTGKTLLARALAASCSTEGRKISFFMRKGADCLSKWVGEAERQLRLLFEEAKNCQPSIIFFDEIDGLAPVRSSKQEQIHASIVSTLLALMDGMDGRGQVIVIGATNRPDAIDPALRRPGRFDREFYFPLPNREARRRILEIQTRGWNPPMEGEFMEELAKLTKGYGGADLRALCTEAALNAVQRTYPQIYKTNDRLMIKPESIGVTARDFTVSQKTLIPSTARSTSSSAAPLPPQLVPLLESGLENAKTALEKVLPDVKKVSVLEEAEYVEEGGGFEKEKMLQAFETLRVYRPRLLICGERGQGQAYVGAAVLHHLEGFHVQTLDLATLVSDSTRTLEAACVQLFVEAKRHKPSILFIPQLKSWCASVGETVRATVTGLLDGLDPSDPVLLLAVLEGEFRELPADVRSWFGFVKGNRVVLGKPGPEQRTAFFADVFVGIRRPPNKYPDAMPRRKRVLEKLPIAPPPPPRAPTAAEIAQQEQNDLRLLEYLKWKLGPVLAELKKRYKRFCRSYYRDWQSDDLEWRQNQLRKNEPVTGLGTQPYHNVDLDSMHSDLYKGYYATPDEFVTDILRIQHNAEVNKIMENDGEAPVRAGQMVNHTKVMLDQTFDANFRAECEKMAKRLDEKNGGKRKREKEKRKGKGGEVHPGEELVAAAKEAAVAGGLNARRPSNGGGGGAEDDEVEVVENGVEGVEGENSLKRAREDSGAQDGEAMEGVEGDGQSPAKRARQDDDEASENGAVVDLIDGQAVASGSGEQLNGLTATAEQPNPQLNGLPAASAATTSFGDLLNPTSSSSLAKFAPTDAASHFSEAPAIINPFAVVPPPMPVGAVPSVSPLRPGALSSTTVPSSFLSGAIPPASAAAVNPFSPAPTASNGDSLQPTATASAAPSRDVTPTPVGANGIVPDPQARRSVSVETGAVPLDKSLEKETTPVPMEEEQEEEPAPREPSREPTPLPLPDFVLPAAELDALANLLTERTAKLTVDQLEQLRAACYDAVWRARAEWDRKGMLKEVRELVEEFVEEVEALEE